VLDQIAAYVQDADGSVKAAILAAIKLVADALPLPAGGATGATGGSSGASGGTGS